MTFAGCGETKHELPIINPDPARVLRGRRELDSSWSPLPLPSHTFRTIVLNFLWLGLDLWKSYLIQRGYGQSIPFIELIRSIEEGNLVVPPGAWGVLEILGLVKL